MSGFATLLYKEVLRFWKVSVQTVAAPVLSALLYLLVFGHALAGHVQVFPGVSYVEFLVPGLAMMSMLQNAFANSSSSLIQSKVTGNIIFILLPPLAPVEIFFAYLLAAIVRALVVGAGVFVATLWIVPLPTTAKPIAHRGFATGMGMSQRVAAKTPRPTTSPRTIAATRYAAKISTGAIGGNRMKTMFPVIFDWMIDEELFANAFCSIAIIARPGMRNCT